jgi:NAD-dependent DNA ligase
VQFPEDDYIWNETGVDIISNSGKNDSADIKTISSFFSELGIKHVSDATISKLFENGQDSLVKILNLSQEDFAKIDGFGEKLAERTFANIHSGLQKSSLKDAISASSCFGFGFGKKKIQKLLQTIPDFYEKEIVSLTEIMAIEGFSEKTATQALYHIPEVQRFVKDISPFIGKEVVVVPSFSSHKLNGYVIVFSGFRDKDLEDFIQKNGGSVGNSVSKNTTMVVTKNPDDSSSKLKKAKENKIPIFSKEDFEKKFFI